MRSDEATVTKEEHLERTMKTSRSAAKYFFFFQVDVCRRKYKEIEVIQEKQNYFSPQWVFFVLKL